MYNGARKINIAHPKLDFLHRSGWEYAIQSLMPLHNPRGVYLDDLHEIFCSGLGPLPIWRNAFSKGVIRGRLRNIRNHRQFQKREEEYLSDWVGFVHSTPYGICSRATHDKLAWKKSALARTCKGIFVLSDYLRGWLQPYLPVPVCSILHPTDIDVPQFTVDKFLKFEDMPNLVQIGLHERYTESIFGIPVRNMRRIWLNPYPKGVSNRKSDSVLQPSFLSDTEYDNVLSSSIVFVHLKDSSANNAIIECIARTTPILVNPLPAVREYLGDAYPFYFETLEEAARKAEDVSLVVRTHEYLKESPIREKLRGEYFLRSFAESEIYQSLPEIS